MAGSDERIEILLETVAKGQEVVPNATAGLKTLKTQAVDTSSGLSGVGEMLAKAFASFSAVAAEVTASLKEINAQVTATNAALTKKAVPVDPAIKNRAALLKEESAAQDAYSKEQAASIAATAKIEANAAKQTAEINALRIAGNREARDTDKERAASMANQAKVEIASAKQVAAEYKIINATRIAGNNEARFKEDQARASQITAGTKAALASEKEAIAAQTGYWKAYYKEQAAGAKSAATEITTAGGAFSSFSDLVQKALSTYIVYKFVGSIKDATSAVLEWMGNMETYGIAIAASLQVGGKYVEKTTGRVLEGAEAFGVAQRDAKGVIEALQVANFQTVATLDQLIRMYQEALPIAMKKGFDKKMVQEFTLSVTQAASAMGVSMDMMAEEARSLLTGAINMRNSRVAVALGITPEDVRQNSASADQLFSFLMGKLQVYRTAGEALQNSWRGLWSNFKDVMMQAGGKALEPLFEGIKTQLREIVENIVTLDTAAGKIIWNPEFLESINAIRDAVKDAWYYAQLLKEVGSAGVGAAKAIGKTGVGSLIDEMNPSKGMSNLSEGKLPLIPGAIWDLISGKGRDNRIFKLFEGFSTEPLKEFGKDQTTAATKFAARQAISESGMGERGFVDVKIKKAAEKYGVDPEDIAGIIYAESNFRNITSKPDEKGKKAYGYMQLRESTAKGLGLDFEDLMDPEKNIMAGTKYYKQLLDMFKGDKEQAMMAYNKGPGFVQKFEAGEYNDPNKQYKVYGKIQTSEDLAKNAAEGEAYYRKAATYSKEMAAGSYYEGGAGDRVRFESQVGMTELNQKAWQEAYKEQIELAHTANTAELKEADDMGKEMKKNLKSQLLSTEEIKQQEAEIDNSTLQQKLQANEKYLASYKFFTDEITNLKDKEGKGVFAKEEDKDTFKSKSIKDLAKIEEEVRGNRRQLGIADAEETQRTNEVARASDLEAAKAKVGNAQWEYDNLKKVNDLKIGLNLITPSAALEVEYLAERKLLEAKRDLISVEEQQQAAGPKKAQLASDLVKINNELADSERIKHRTVVEGIKTDEIKAKNLAALLSAQIAYNQVIADPTAVEALAQRSELSNLATAADTAQRLGLLELAGVYRQTAAALKELNSGSDMYVGLKKAMRDVTNEIGSNANQWKNLFKGVAGDMKSSLSTLMFEGFKGNLNPDKDRQVYDTTKQLANIALQKQQLALDKEVIASNNSLSESEKQTAQATIDAKLKQLEVEEKLAEAQKQAAENSKGTSEIWQGFLDSILKKATDFMADSAIKDLFGLLSGETKPGSGSGKSIFTTFFGWLTEAKTKTAESVGEIGTTVTDGIGAISGKIEGAGGGMVNSFSSIFSKMAEVAWGWMKSIYEAVVNYMAALIKAIGSSGFFSNFFGGASPGAGAAAEGGAEAGAGAAGSVGGFGEGLASFAHKGGFTANMMHKGGAVLKYHGGGLTSNEVPIIAQKGEYVLSREDVDFVKKVKNTSPTVINNINVQSGRGAGSAASPVLVPLGVTVMMDNQSSELLQASARGRQTKDDQQYIIDVVLNNINSRGVLGGLR